MTRPAHFSTSAILSAIYPAGPRTLCNACGLVYAKLVRIFSASSAELLPHNACRLRSAHESRDEFAAGIQSNPVLMATPAGTTAATLNPVALTKSGATWEKPQGEADPIQHRTPALTFFYGRSDILERPVCGNC